MGPMGDPKLELRDFLADIYGETLAEEFTVGIVAYTLENMAQEELDRLEGPVAGKYRHALIPYLEDLQTRVAANIDAIKNMPPEQFQLESDDDAETDLEEEASTPTPPATEAPS